MHVDSYAAERLALAQRIVAHLTVYSDEYLTALVVAVFFAVMAAAAFHSNEPHTMARTAKTLACVPLAQPATPVVKEL